MSASSDAAAAAVPPPVSKLPLYAMGALVVLVLLSALVLGLRGPKTFPAGSPEAAVQDYLDAALDADHDAMVATLVADRRAACADKLDDRSSGYGFSGTGFELDDMRISGSSARAELTQRRDSSGDPFDSSRNTSDLVIELEQADDGQWYVSDTPWPWWLGNCLDAP